MSEYYERVKFPCGLEYEQKIRAIIIIDKDDSDMVISHYNRRGIKNLIGDWSCVCSTNTINMYFFYIRRKR